MNDIGHGGSLASSPATASVALQIRKAGSTQVAQLRAVLDEAARREPPHIFATPKGTPGGRTWMFVRDPFARMLAGYAEIEGRLVEAHGVCLDFGSNWTLGREPTHNGLPARAIGNFSALPLRNLWIGQDMVGARCRWELSHKQAGLFFRRHRFGTVERVRTFFQQLLAGDLHNFSYVRRGSHTINHAYPQCHYLCGGAHLNAPSGWMFVGQLERYEQDVVQLIQRLGFAQSRRYSTVVNASLKRGNIKKLYVHDNASRYAISTAAARRAFDQDMPTRYAICHLVAIDLACINPLLPPHRRYQKPIQCDGIPGSPLES
jgi:hypothetical protein